MSAIPEKALRRPASTFILWIVIALAVLVRMGHVVLQPSVDPAFAHPGLDAKYYLEWARALAHGTPGPGGAFYLAPLYPHVLGAWIGVFGEHLTAWLTVQHAAMLASAGFLAAVARRSAGPAAGVIAAALFLFYHPTVFFASRPLSESLALVLLCSGVWLASRGSTRSALAAGAVLGLAGLTKPNLLLVPVFWIAGDVLAQRWRRVASMALPMLLVLAPVTLRNFIVSGHPVLVSSNGGLTLFHGNGPGSLGIFNPPDRFSGALASQRDEATTLARALSGLELDAVQADHWWGRQAIRTRIEDPVGSAVLLAVKLLLTIDDYEHGLDDPPMMDPNPWACLWSVPGSDHAGALPRRVSFVPFAVIFGLAIGGLVARGLRGSGGPHVWSAIAACALTPLLFYASSRYRLPLAALLVVPAGAGVAALLGRLEARPGRLRAARAVFVACTAASFFVPFKGLRAAEEGGALSNRAAVLAQAGDLLGAERTARRASLVDPASTYPHFVLGVVLERAGRDVEAEHEYRDVVSRDPTHAEAAGNLGRLLTSTGRPAEGVPILRAALAARPGHRSCSINLVVALAVAGDRVGARRAIVDARNAGVVIDPDLVRMVDGP